MTAIKGFRHVRGGRSWTVRNRRSSPRTWWSGLVHLCIIGRKRIHLEKYISGESGKLCQISGAGPILIMSQFFSICWRCLSVLCCAMQSQLFGQIRGVGPPDRATWAQQEEIYYAQSGCSSVSILEVFSFTPFQDTDQDYYYYFRGGYSSKGEPCSDGDKLLNPYAGLGHEMRGTNCQDIQLVPIVAHFRAVNYYDCHLIKASTTTATNWFLNPPLVNPELKLFPINYILECNCNANTWL